mgnify:FL=1
MRTLFSIFILSILSSSVMGELVCERIDGCALFPEAKTESEYCPTCVSPVVSIPELTKSSNSGNMCIEKFDECVLSASKRVGGSTYLCHNIKKECEISL